MKISQNVSYLNTSAATAGVASGKGSAAASAPQGTTAVVTAARLPSTTGDFDAKRVAEIRESIRAGRYQIDTAKIADGLLSSVQDLIGKNPT